MRSYIMRKIILRSVVSLAALAAVSGGWYSTLR